MITFSSLAVRSPRKLGNLPARKAPRRSRFLSRVGSTLLAPTSAHGLDAAARSRRLYGIQLILGTLAIGVGGRLVYLSTFEHERWRSLASRQQETSIEIQGARGTVRDVTGRALVSSIETASIAIHPRQISTPDVTAELLSRMTELSAQEIREKLALERPFVWLARGVAREVGAEVRNAKLRGVSVFPEFQRVYPNGNLAAVLLGRVSSAGHGQSGIELAFEQALSAPSRVLSVRRDARGGIFSRAEEHSELPLDLSSSILPEVFRSVAYSPAMLFDNAVIRAEGGDIVLTLDIVLQEILETEIARGLAEAKGKRAFGLLMDAESGEIIALAQAPRPLLATAARVTPEDMRNYVIQDSFEPGSTFKPLVVAQALERRLVRMNELVECENGNFRVGKHTIRDVHPLGTARVRDILVQSSNIGTAKVGIRLGRERMPEAIRGLGFGQPTGVELPGESRGIISREWLPIDVVTNSFGQGISVTAMQLVRAYASLANGGWLVTPTIVKGMGPRMRKRVFREEVAREMADVLVGVTSDEEGTGKQASINGVPVAGKTGTAHQPRRNGRGYDPAHVLSSFIGFVDGSAVGIDRRLVLFVGVDEPTVQPRWGGVVAAPIFRRTMERTLSHLMSSRSRGLQAARPAGERERVS